MQENKRWLETPSVKQKESIADHSYKVLVMVFVLGEHLKLNIDKLKCLKIALVHDLVEAIAGDTDYNSVYLGLISKREKQEKEMVAMKQIIKILPEDIGDEIFELWQEYDNGSTYESRFVKAVEKTESIIHVIDIGHETINIPDKFATYCDKAMDNFPELRGYYKGVKRKLKEMYKAGNHEWRNSYEEDTNLEEMKDFDSIFDFFQIVQKLKYNKRYGSLKQDEIKESIVGHMFKLTFFVWMSTSLFGFDIDLQKALELAIFHDVVEAFEGDIDFELIYTGKVSKETKNNRELFAINKIKKILPKDIGNNIYELWQEYEEYSTEEAKLVKALDKLESIDHFVRFGPNYIDRPDRIAFYLNSSLKFDEKIYEIHTLYRTKLRETYIKGGIEWKKEYDLV